MGNRQSFLPLHFPILPMKPTISLEAVSKPPARRCAAVGGGWQEATTTSIELKIRGGGATPPATARRKQRPREVLKQFLAFSALSASHNPQKNLSAGTFHRPSPFII